MYYEGYPQKLQKKTLEKSNGVTSRLDDASCKYLLTDEVSRSSFCLGCISKSKTKFNKNEGKRRNNFITEDIK